MCLVPGLLLLLILSACSCHLHDEVLQRTNDEPLSLVYFGLCLHLRRVVRPAVIYNLHVNERTSSAAVSPPGNFQKGFVLCLRVPWVVWVVV